MFLSDLLQEAREGDSGVAVDANLSSKPQRNWVLLCSQHRRISESCSPHNLHCEIDMSGLVRISQWWLLRLLGSPQGLVPHCHLQNTT